MHTAESLLIELRARSFALSEQYILGFKKLHGENPENDLNNFTKLIATDYKRAQATLGTDILHKSITEGVDDQLRLIIGVQEINRETAMEVQRRVTEIMSQ